MRKKSTGHIWVHEDTFLRFRKLGTVGETYDSVLTKLLDVGERKLLEERALEEAIINTQK